MLFNSLIFIFFFLPVVFLIHRLLLQRGWTRSAACGLLLASLVFYGWWDARYVLLLASTIIFNYQAGQWIQNRRAVGKSARTLFYIAVSANILLLGFFKYTAFAVESFNGLFQMDLPIPRIVLPLGISLFTFQNIGYLADVYQGKVRDTNFLNYALFVSFFPQLVAGPVVHHGELIPQFASRWRNADSRMLTMGLSFFSLGLFHKCFLADGVAPIADRVFHAAAEGHMVGWQDAWLGTAAYTMQIYYDFAGYSYMAIGLAAFFNLKLPANFNSPYQANSLIEFWRCWHMTLSRFLRDYIYIPLGGNKCSQIRQTVNLAIVMLIGGLWHGAGWNFILWGLLHGVGLTLNHLSRKNPFIQAFPHWVGRLLTFLFVMATWVLFRASDFTAAGRIYSGMIGLNGGFSQSVWSQAKDWQLALLAAICAGALFLPNWISIFYKQQPTIDSEQFADKTRSIWSLLFGNSIARGVAIGLLALIAVLSLSRESPFLYFQF